MKLLEGQAVVITGAGSGVGRASAQLFAAHGASVVCADLREDWNAETARLASAQGPEASTFRCDVSSESDVAGLIETTRERHGRIDAIFNNAGVAPFRLDAKVEEFDEAEVDRLLDINFKGVYWGCKHAVAAFKEQGGWGAIVTTASASGLVGWGGVAYGATKAGVVGMTRSLAIEVAPFGIRVNCVCPGGIDTNFGRSAQEAFTERAPEQLERLHSFHPLGKAPTPEDVAEAALFLLSPMAANVTGVALPVDGGYTAA